MTSRRAFLGELAGLSLAGAFVPVASSLGRFRTAGTAFTLGVASGDPTADGIVLWTRLAPDPLQGGGMPDRAASVRWELAEDDGFRRIVQRGAADALPDWAHAVHVEVTGLQPARWYWYRFMTGDDVSPTGRTRTAPSGATERLRLVISSCQHYENGFYAAHRHLAQEDVDCVFHLGDYIYESNSNPLTRARAHGTSEPRTLAEYRNRYALYKTDPNLQAAHAAFPWVVTWDDHEVDNNYVDAASADGESPATFLLRRAAAYRAYYEHMPLRRATIPTGPDALLYRQLQFGSLARVHVLDTRQYRSDQACGDGRKAPCAEWSDPSRTVMGAAQERWLESGLAGTTTWQVLAQQVMMGKFDLMPGPGEMYPMDVWSGYPAARDRLTHAVAQRDLRNVVVLTGDIHSSWANDILRDFTDHRSPVVMSEFVTTSITSGGDGADAWPQWAMLAADNPWLKFHHARRGYVRCEVTPEQWRADYRALPYVSNPDAPIATVASFLTEHGTPGVQRV